MTLPPKAYQREAVDNVLSIFRYAFEQMEVAPDQTNRKRIVAYNGCVLIQAPTGSGKTAMAGMIAEQFSKEPPVIWFWFTPFKGLVDQAGLSLSKHFAGLRVRNIQKDRIARGSQSGDVFVATWASVASKAEDKKLRLDDDTALALDSLIPMLRQSGFQIGVVVDEAHHSFTSATEAVRFYNSVMQPEYTLLITATPDDRDVASFKKATGIVEVHMVTVSREDAVAAGLIKKGVKSVAYLAPDERKELIDFRMAALADAKRAHEAIKQQLREIGVNLVPLMLVQVASSSDDDVAQATSCLKSLGFKEEAIASYTADEPSADLLAVAIDESKEVLIFKMAVALGFDAPRAFTLVSMRSAKDTDFGVQLVGRILRVHSSLQGRELPDSLSHGYVFLADAENQTGLTTAAEKINSIETSLSTVSPYTMVVNIAGRNEVQVVKNGQSTMLPVEAEFMTPAAVGGSTSEVDRDPNRRDGTGSGFSMSGAMQPLFDGLVLSLPQALPQAVQKKAQAIAQTGQFALKVPGLAFQTERMPLGTSDLLQCIAKRVQFGDRELNEARRLKTSVIRREEEIFTRSVTDSKIQVALSESQIARRAQKVLFEPDFLDARDLHDALLARLKLEFDERGFEYGEDDLEMGLNQILAGFPLLVRQAARECSATYAELQDAAPMPAFVEAGSGARTSRLNAYGVMPPDLNKDELAFADLLDADTSGVVEWWSRNEPRKPWSVGIVLPNGAHYYPDFIVKVKGRSVGKGLLLVEIKGDHILNSTDSLDKVLASHKAYKRPVMLVRDDSGRFMTVRQDASGKNVEDQIFRVDLMAAL